MSTRIRGNAGFTCNACQQKHELEGNQFTFTSDSGSADDEADIHYLAAVALNCTSCEQPISIEFDVWEYPRAVVNYCYHSEQGVNNIQCEFAIEYHQQEGQEGLDNDDREEVALAEDVDDDAHDDYEGSTDYAGDGRNFHDGSLDDFDADD